MIVMVMEFLMVIMLLAEHGYPPVDNNEVYQEVFEQAENFKKFS